MRGGGQKEVGGKKNKRGKRAGFIFGSLCRQKVAADLRVSKDGSSKYESTSQQRGGKVTALWETANPRRAGGIVWGGRKLCESLRGGGGYCCTKAEAVGRDETRREGEVTSSEQSIVGSPCVLPVLQSLSVQRRQRATQLALRLHNVAEAGQTRRGLWGRWRHAAAVGVVRRRIRAAARLLEPDTPLRLRLRLPRRRGIRVPRGRGHGGKRGTGESGSCGRLRRVVPGLVKRLLQQADVCLQRLDLARQHLPVLARPRQLLLVAGGQVLLALAAESLRRLKRGAAAEAFVQRIELRVLRAAVCGVCLEGVCLDGGQAVGEVAEQQRDGGGLLARLLLDALEDLAQVAVVEQPVRERPQPRQRDVEARIVARVLLQLVQRNRALRGAVLLHDPHRLHTHRRAEPLRPRLLRPPRSLVVRVAHALCDDGHDAGEGVVAAGGHDAAAAAPAVAHAQLHGTQLVVDVRVVVRRLVRFLQHLEVACRAVVGALLPAAICKLVRLADVVKGVHDNGKQHVQEEKVTHHKVRPHEERRPHRLRRRQRLPLELVLHEQNAQKPRNGGNQRFHLGDVRGEQKDAAQRVAEQHKSKDDGEAEDVVCCVADCLRQHVEEGEVLEVLEHPQIRHDRGNGQCVCHTPVYSAVGRQEVKCLEVVDEPRCGIVHAGSAAAAATTAPAPASTRAGVAVVRHVRSGLPQVPPSLQKHHHDDDMRGFVHSPGSDGHTRRAQLQLQLHVRDQRVQQRRAEDRQQHVEEKQKAVQIGAGHRAEEKDATVAPRLDSAGLEELDMARRAREQPGVGVVEQHVEGYETRGCVDVAAFLQRIHLLLHVCGGCVASQVDVPAVLSARVVVHAPACCHRLRVIPVVCQ
eukprot:Rhum_TRINITY_DN14912_c4_g1::Rhum_TRINITY_DN14912_c4_g1_i1::g.128182::m.128182